MFNTLGCSACHVPDHMTSEFPELPVLSGHLIRPYTDLLLHDMGAGLADTRPDGSATPRQWRTAPLWGLGLNATVNGNAALLHDGRARNAAEAILWHGGEAQSARNRFAKMSKADREALVRFVNSI